VHHPYHLAKAVAALDQMSGGRFIFGVGLGGAAQGRDFSEANSYFAVGSEPGHRVGRFMENLRIVKALWAEDRVTYDGRFWKLDDVELLPKTVQQPHPPIWFGGEHPNMMRRTAKYADGWTAVGDIPTSEYKEALGLLRQYLEEFGRDPAEFTINRKAFVAVDSDGERAKKKAYDWFEKVLGFGPPKAVEAPIAGTVSEVTDKLGEIIQSGVDVITLNHWFDPNEFAEQIEIFGTEIIPRLTEGRQDATKSK
jgi:alkanesulfonate monooxygenase SsuD/methylene tetrahydromethanopterin reductase-like flavin-dependent oxidoreductase (luciferase family)